MSNSEKNALIQSGSTTAHAELYTDADGNVHYFDESGNETLVLSAKEAAEYEREKEKAREQDVIDSTLLVDVSTITPVIPASITEVASQSNGYFSDFAHKHHYTYNVDEDGRYCFYITHYSAGVELFSNCNITISE